MKRASLVLPLLLVLPLFAVACGGGTDEPTDAGSTCGDGVCEGRETLNSCPEDCVECGDHECTVDNVPASAAASWAESIDSCQQDCGGTYVCGNLRCESATETAELCPYDCVTCGDGTCHRDYGENAVNCDADCPPVCGDGACTKGESVSNCRRDCDAGGTCGDGVCNYAENKQNCIDDCADVCSEIGTAENLGEACGGKTGVDCGDWGICIRTESGSVCMQKCWLNTCEALCGGASCQALQESQESDQHQGVYVGICYSGPAVAKSYEPCGEEVAQCANSLFCADLGVGQMMCLSGCTEDGDCPAKGAFAGTCALSDSQGNKACALECDPAQADSCPTGMNCNEGICIWP